ncbi:MAG: glycosyltransferase family 4 protein [Rhodospirillum sp.]|nr:glycosyltransferase family 4 protein [Rhodospirillum sp.]MCF8491411.1 glycosyltransferase family 4 protein [Rhodospirillum sp.]
MNQDLVFAFPGALGTRTGGYAYDRRVIVELGTLGWTVDPLPLGDGFPFPSPAVKAAAEDRLSALSDDTRVVIDGLAFGVLDAWAEREARRLRITALVHHPLALESGLGEEDRVRFQRTEERALCFAARVIVTSPMTARDLTARFGVAADRITVACPGTDPGPISPGDGDPPHILSIGTLTPRKGHDVLLAALQRVEDLAWTVTIVGSSALAPDTALALRGQCLDLGLGDRVVFAGDCLDTRPLLASADLFALASRYEGYGMAFAEALSQGVPIVSCRAGAIPEVVPEDAGILVPVDDPEAFAGALRCLLSDKGRRARMAQAARRAGAALPSWQVTTATIARTLEAPS